MTDPVWWVEHYQLTLLVTALWGLAVGLTGHHLHLVYRISGKGGRRLRCGITRVRRYWTRMGEYRKGKDRGSNSWEWNREVWCWLPIPYRLHRLFGDGWARRAVTVQLVWGRNRVLRVEQAEIERVVQESHGVEPVYNRQHAGQAARARAARQKAAA